MNKDLRTIEEVKWLQVRALKDTYERIQLANEAMASFYSNENRSKYLYNE